MKSRQLNWLRYFPFKSHRKSRRRNRTKRVMVGCLVCTCVSDKPKLFANSTRSGVLKYFCVSKRFSKPLNCWSLNTVRALRRRHNFIGFLCGMETKREPLFVDEHADDVDVEPICDWVRWLRFALRLLLLATIDAANADAAAAAIGFP